MRSIKAVLCQQIPISFDDFPAPPYLFMASLEEKMGYTPIKAAHGTKLSCKGWAQEAALRMLNNNLDEAVGENPR